MAVSLMVGVSSFFRIELPLVAQPAPVTNTKIEPVAARRDPGLFEPALPLGVDESPALFGEFAPSVPLCERDGELGLKLGVNRLVVAYNRVDVLVWLPSGVDERMDRGGHPASHRPNGRAPSVTVSHRSDNEGAR